MNRRSVLSMVIAFAVLGALASLSSAHPAHLASANAVIQSDGRFRVTVSFDLLAYALNDIPARIEDADMNALLDGPDDVLQRRLDDARQRFLNAFAVRCAPQQTEVRAEAIRFPSVADVRRWCESGPTPRLPVVQLLSVEGSLPTTTRSVAFHFPESLGTIVLSVDRPGEEPYSEPLDAGQASLALPLRLNDAPDQVDATRSGTFHAMWRYLVLGFTHILPHGLDHILFVLGLFLLSARMGPLLWQVTAFTIAHSMTLGMSLYGVVRVPPQIVEPIIAFSIAFIAIENLFTTDLKPWRPLVVFGFGLIHGLGFAGVLMEAGLPRAQCATALVGFNIGVELGQLAVIVLALAALGWWRRRDWYRRIIAMPASTVIAVIAIFWTFQRVLSG